MEIEKLSSGCPPTMLQAWPKTFNSRFVGNPYLI